MKRTITGYIIATAMFSSLNIAWAQQQASNAAGDDHHFQVTSTTFSAAGMLPLSMVWNQCTYFPGGGNISASSVESVGKLAGSVI
jgi:hypothetical protein